MRITDVYFRIKNAFLYKLLLRLPYSKWRVYALKLLGHKCGKDVYFPSDIIVTQNFVRNRGQLVLGNRVSIGPRVTLILSSHPNSSKIRGTIKEKESCIVIHDDVWIGAGSIILPGLTIGECAIVGAGAVVTKDVPAYCVVAGNPARIISFIK